LSFKFGNKNEFHYFANLKFGGFCSFKKRKLRTNSEGWEKMAREGVGIINNPSTGQQKSSHTHGKGRNGIWHGGHFSKKAKATKRPGWTF
jgi:hypothetical protein